MDVRLTNRSAFSLPGAWPSTDSFEEALDLPSADPPTEEPRSANFRSESGKPTGEISLRNSVATYDDDSDDFYSFVESQEVKHTYIYFAAHIDLFS